MAAQLGAPAAAIRAHEELFAYWNSLRRGLGLPARRDVDPGHLKRHLPMVSLVDVAHGETPEYKFRLAGTALYNVYGREVTGRRVVDVYGSSADYWRTELTKVVEERRPVVGVHNLAWRGQPHLSLIWLRMPLAPSPYAEVDMILGYDAVVGMGHVITGIRAA
jgi:hypothetical protein